MNASHRIFVLLMVLQAGAFASKPASSLPSRPDTVPEGLSKADWTSIQAAYEAGRHAFQPVEGGWHARNPGQQWTTTFDRRGFLARPREGDWTWGLELQSYGFGDKQQAIRGIPTVKAEGQRLSYQWDANVQEWFVNDQKGLEHGFTIAERPVSASAGLPFSESHSLSFTLATRGNLKPIISADSQGVLYQDPTGATVLNYTGLKVWDADGKILPSHFEAEGKRQVRLVVEDAGAQYPLSIDPVAQQAYLKASNTGGSDRFGWSVALSGNTVVVGAYDEGSSSGAAYIFTRVGTTWAQQAYLKASNTGASDRFGASVAVSGDTVVVGAWSEGSNATGVNGDQVDNSASAAGAAYIFTRVGTTWEQQAYLKASNTNANDRFGHSVAVSGETVVVGAYGEDSNATGVNGNQADNSASSAGAAYVFTRSGTTWTQQAYLKASNTGANDQFGQSVAASGDTVVVGANGEASNAAGVNGNQADNSASNAGSVYVFTRSGTAWTQQAYLKASNTGTNDGFGWSVAVSQNTVVVGAYGDDSNATGINGVGANNSASNAGAAYVFTRTGTTWTQQAYLKASNTDANDLFGWSVAVSGDTVLVGASEEDSNATGVNGNQANTTNEAGAAYVFTRSGSTWTQQSYLKASNTDANDRFGTSVAVSGDTMVVGAWVEASNATGVNGDGSSNSTPFAGAAYIFGPLSPEISMEQPAFTDLTSGSATISFGNVVPGSGGSVAKTFTIRNTGIDPLTLTSVSTIGVNAADFAVNTTGMFSTVPATSGSTTFSVTFTPAAYGGRSTTLRLLNDDRDEGTFDITLTGASLAFNIDTDNDGLNDASEFQMAEMVFDWQTNQPGLATTLTSNLNGAGYYTAAQVQGLHVGKPLIQRHPTTGVFTVTLGLEKSTTLQPGSFQPFPMTFPQTVINGAGKLEFQFTVPDNAAFFRLQAQ
ncbi:MAG: choice-of-anchor D domain-containing protein [Verrucomicrobiaceae bacterium]|nr:choice-of-anchor D domain-containing protein [Verrucomicrobiaceae bacterium]